jgi:hypothetical protein
VEQYVANAAVACVTEGAPVSVGWFTLISDLVRTLPWPTVAFFFIYYFREEIRGLLAALPAVLERLRSAKMLGIELNLAEVGQRLPIAEEEAKSLRLPPGEVPQLPGKKGGSQSDK